MNTKEMEATMYSRLRLRIADDISCHATINSIRSHYSIQGGRRQPVFTVYVEAFGKVIMGSGATENAIVDTLKASLEKFYRAEAKRVESKIG